MEPASCQRSLTVPGTLSRQIWWSGLEIIGTPPCSVHTAPTARRACGFETRVPAKPLCHFPKGGMTLSKAATLVGDFPGPNVALNPHLPTVALIQNDAENASPFSAVNDGPGLAERPQLPGRKSRRLQPLRAQRPRRAWPASARDQCGRSQRPREDWGCGLGVRKQRLTVSVVDSISRRWATAVSPKRATAGEAKRRTSATPALPGARGTAAPAARPPRELLCRS